MKIKKLPYEYVPSPLSGLGDMELLAIIAASPKGAIAFSSTASVAWGELTMRYHNRMMKLVYESLFNDLYYIGMANMRAMIVEDLVTETFFRLKDTEAANHYNGRSKTITWLCRIAKNVFREKLRKKILTYDEVKLLDPKRRYEYLKDVEPEVEIGGERLSHDSYNYIVQEKYLKENFTKIEIEVIMAYFKYYQDDAERVHMPPSLKKYFYEHGLTDEKIWQLISRFKKKYYADCKELMKFRD